MLSKLQKSKKEGSQKWVDDQRIPGEIYLDDDLEEVFGVGKAEKFS